MSQSVLRLTLADLAPGQNDAQRLSAEIGIGVETQLSKVEHLWRNFENSASGHVFQSFGWVSIWHSTIGRHAGITPQIVIGRAPGGTVLFLLPLGIRRRFGVTILEWLGGAQAELKSGFFDQTFLRGLTMEEWTTLWRRIVALLPPVDLVHLNDQPERLEDVTNPFASLRTHRQAEQSHAVRLHGDWTSWCESRLASGTAATNPAPAAPPAEAACRTGELRYEIANDPERVSTVLQKLFADKAKLSTRKGFANPFSDSAVRTFYWRQAQRMYPHGPVHLSALTLDGKPIAIDWGLIFRGRFYYLLSARDMRLRNLSLKRCQRNELLRWCVEHGLEHFAFGVNHRAGTYRWCEEHMGLFSIIKGCTWKGRIAAMLFGMNVRLKRHAGRSKLWRRLARDMRLLIHPPIPHRA